MFGSGRDRTEPRIVSRISDSLKQATTTWRNGGARADTTRDDDKLAKVDENATPDESAEQPVDESATPPASSEKETKKDDSSAAADRTPEPAPERERTRASQSRQSERTAVASVPDLATPVRATSIAPTTTLTDRLTERRVSALESLRETVTASVARAATALSTVTVAPTAQLTAASTDAPTQQPEQPRAPKLVSGLLAAVGLAPFAANSPLAPAQSTPLLALLGWARRESDRGLTQVARSLSVQPTAAVTTAELRDPLPGSLDSRRVGAITGPGITDSQRIYGTDLGIMWDGGVLTDGDLAGERFVHVVFGDTFSGPNMTGNWISNAIMISVDRTLSTDASEFLVPSGPAFQFIPGGQALSWLFPTEVTVIPTAGIRANNTQYVNYMSVRQWGVPGEWTTNFSAISRYNAATDQWQMVPSTVRSAGWFRSSTPYRPGDQNFQQMAYVRAPEAAADGTQYIYAFGTPSGRQGSVHLSRVAEADIADLSKYEYWDGNDWVSSTAHAAPIIGDSTQSAGLFGFIVDLANNPNVFGGYFGGLLGAKTGGNVSEMSVQYNEYLGKYVILYGDGNNDIQMRIAETPEGPWSDPITLATSRQYPGLYAPMIHPWSGTGYLLDENEEPDRSTLYWNMSLWDPYNVYLMETDLTPLTVQQV
ncbi:DUF4185 domain-containing protein [Mycolicibacterium thermoresistibile]